MNEASSCDLPGEVKRTADSSALADELSAHRAESKLKRGQEAEIWVDTSKLHFFDARSGRAVGEPELALSR